VQGHSLKIPDDVPYAILGAILAAVGFLVGNLVFYREPWQLVAAPMVGAVLGLAAGMHVVRSRNLRFFATLREFTATIADENKTKRS
jgi:ribose/xylose/arabinose/galactoside ABC-type transport system permease subunit